IVASDGIVDVRLGNDVPKRSGVAIERRPQVENIFGRELQVQRGIPVMGNAEANVVEISLQIPWVWPIHGRPMGAQRFDPLIVEGADFDLILSSPKLDAFTDAGVQANDGFSFPGKNRDIVDVDLVALEGIVLVGELGLKLGKLSILLCLHQTYLRSVERESRGARAEPAAL